MNNMHLSYFGFLNLSGLFFLHILLPTLVYVTVCFYAIPHLIKTFCFFDLICAEKFGFKFNFRSWMFTVFLFAFAEILLKVEKVLYWHLSVSVRNLEDCLSRKYKEI